MSQEKIAYLLLDVVVATIQARTEFSEESLRSLADTLAAVGQLAPIRVRKEGDLYVIVDGERRYRAAKMAGFTTIAAIIEEQDLAVAAIRHRQLVANCHETLTPMDTANAVAELMQETGWSAAEVAAKIGMSQATISRLLTLKQLPPPIQTQIKDGKIPASAGYELSRVVDAGEQEALAAQVANGLTRDGLTGIVKSNGTGHSRSLTEKASRFKAELGAGRSITAYGSGLDNLETLIGWLEALLARLRKLRPKGLELAAIARLFRDEAKTGT